ncbi:hypothetical protein LCI18_011136 [Fusarium solani-melongenae]|uniref:Uncharacterized protein n=1 Tax=Fusarium solani subsp. cucurbitae TaxID=2747967 RepID=A0ACD3ZGE6_FUSSC|nr:hypothetical protein LCI18_011136 [Fusarium solani-melongenae]
MNTETTQSDLDRPRLAPPLIPQRASHGAERKSLSHNDYTVGWVCALPLELGVATAMLDEEHQTLPVCPGDKNTYTLGRIEHHNVVLVCLPSCGTTKAAIVASHMLRSYPNIQAGLMVGIGGGAPTSDADIRLGDIIVGDLVVQYDLGKTVKGGKFERIDGSGKSPPENLKMAVQSLRGRHNLQPRRIPDMISEMLKRHPSARERYTRPVAAWDQLFDAAYDHVEGPNDGNAVHCGRCDISRLVPRPPRFETHCKIHYGKIASGNRVLKHGKTRDHLAQELGAVCFEMEAAGLVDANFPCLVVRGISDYADSHKNNEWQGFAAAAAAAYAKELLAILPTSQNPSRFTSQGHLPDDVSRKGSLGQKMSLERSETGSVVPEFPLKGSNGTETAQSQLTSAVETLERLESIIQVSTKDMKAVSRSFRHDATRMALKMRRAERLFFRIRRPIHNAARLDRKKRLAHSATLTDYSIVSDLALSLQKLNCGAQFEAEDDRPVSKRAFKFKFKVSVPSLTNSAFSSPGLLPSEETVQKSSSVDSAAVVPTDSVEHHLALQSENDMEGIIRDDCSVTDKSFGPCVFTTSLTPSHFAFIKEEGHTYDHMASREYMLPNDDSWTSAEEVLHFVLHDMALSRKPLLGSVANFEGRVLDVGTGIGWWAIDMADDCPRADVIGIDLSPIQPEYMPLNCRFLLDDLETSYDLAFACSDYYPDVIHCRNMVMAIYDWTRFIAWIKRELEPGGLVEFQELLWCPCIQDGGITKPYTGPLAEFFQTLAQAFSACGISLDAPRYLQTGLELSGFKDVSQQDFLIPLGKWSNDPKPKDMGAYFYYFLLVAIEPLSSRVLRRGLNYCPSEAKLWAERFKKTLKESRRELIFFQFIVVHGRKYRAIQ